MKSYLLFVVFVLSASFASALPRIDIDTDDDDCVDGWITMDVTVRVDGESFNFNPSCSFSFRDTFKTSRSIECEIEAGMCSGFSPRNKIEVSCGSARDSKSIDCPE